MTFMQVSPEFTFTPHGENEMVAESHCISCRQKISITMTINQYSALRRGAYPQVALSDKSAGEREFLISRLCEKCWDEIWKGE